MKSTCGASVVVGRRLNEFDKKQFNFYGSDNLCGEFEVGRMPPVWTVSELGRSSWEENIILACEANGLANGYLCKTSYPN